MTRIDTSHTITGFGDTVQNAISVAEKQARLFCSALSRVGADAAVFSVKTLINDHGVFHLITYTGYGLEEAMRMVEV